MPIILCNNKFCNDYREDEIANCLDYFELDTVLLCPTYRKVNKLPQSNYAKEKFKNSHRKIVRLKKGLTK